MSRRAVWFGPEGAPLFGWLHVPEVNPLGAVVICPPLGEEYKNSHTTLRMLSGQLEAAGFVVLHFDYEGTGDSSGQPSAHGWSNTLKASVTTAVTFVAALTSAPITVVGMRMGAVIAANAVSDNAVSDNAVDSLVLWDPCSSGRSFLREQQALGAQLATSAPLTGWVDGPEYAFPRSLEEGLTLESACEPLARRVLMLLREDRPKPKGLLKWASDVGADLADAAGQADMLDAGSIFRRVPVLALFSVASWITSSAELGAGSARRPGGAEGDRVLFTEDGGPPFTERCVTIGAASLFGILTEPVQADPALPLLIFLSVANDHRAATGRLWVDLARTMVGHGFRSLRFDLSGLGDSPARGGEATQMIRSLAHFDDVADALNEMAPDDHRNVVFVGLCSSGYQSLEAAFTHRSRGVCVINPALFFNPPELMDTVETIDPRRRFCTPSSPVVDALRQRRLVGVVKKRWPNLSWRMAHLLIRSPSPISQLNDMVQAGTRVLLICGDREERMLRQSAPRSFDMLRKTEGAKVEVLTGAEHYLPSVSDRRQVQSLVEGFLRTQFPTQFRTQFPTQRHPEGKLEGSPTTGSL